MIIKSKKFNNIQKKSSTVSSKEEAEIKALQKQVRLQLNKNIEEIEQYTKQLPQELSRQDELIKSLEKLAQLNHISK